MRYSIRQRAAPSGSTINVLRAAQLDHPALPDSTQRQAVLAVHLRGKRQGLAQRVGGIDEQRALAAHFKWHAHDTAGGRRHAL